LQLQAKHFQICGLNCQTFPTISLAVLWKTNALQGEKDIFPPADFFCDSANAPSWWDEEDIGSVTQFLFFRKPRQRIGVSRLRTCAPPLVSLRPFATKNPRAFAPGPGLV
jgi:hypothetical protein